jgi:23S rRNA (uracil1939-C5)-methyltransferase
MSRKNKKNLILENIKLLNAGAKGVAIGRTEEGKTVWFPEQFREMW